jgi:hypothetical protein
MSMCIHPTYTHTRTHTHLHIIHVLLYGLASEQICFQLVGQVDAQVDPFLGFFAGQPGLLLLDDEALTACASVCVCVRV